METYKKGISLIVLVITIIVMAILASAVIISLSNASIIEQAKGAVDANNATVAKEALALTVADWYSTNKSTSLKGKLEAIPGVTSVTGDETDELIVTINGLKFKVTADGEVFEYVPTLEVGSFVKYDVAYTDIFDSTRTYTADNGWRIVDFTKNADGTYSNVKIMSAGIPVNIYFDRYWALTNAAWAYSGTARPNESSVADTLYYNFGLVPFSYGTNAKVNTGYFTRIAVTKNNVTTTYDSTQNTSGTVDNATGNDLFNILGSRATVRVITKEEVTEITGVEITGLPDNAINSSEDSNGIFILNPEGLWNEAYALASTPLYSEYYYYDDLYSDAHTPVSYALWSISVNGSVGFADFQWDSADSNDSVGPGNCPIRPLIEISGNVSFTDTDSDGVWELSL